MAQNMSDFFRSRITRLLIAYTIGLNVGFLAGVLILVVGWWTGHPNVGGFLGIVIGLVAGIAAGITVDQAMKRMAG
jgi:hypothetical protein